MIAHLAALLQVVFLDLALAADNAVAVGLAAAALPQALRKQAIFWGVSVALVLRIIFALLAVYLLKITGLLLVDALPISERGGCGRISAPSPTKTVRKSKRRRVSAAL